jgi:hypothetical protein
MDVYIIPAHPLLSPTDQIMTSADGDESHVCTGERSRELKAMGVNIITPKPNTTQDCAPPDLVTFCVMQSAIRSAIATRQRLLRKLPHHRPLDYRGVVATLALAIEKGMTRKNCIAAYEEAGLYPFTRKTLMAAHIAPSKGKTVKTWTPDYDAIDCDKPVKPHVAHQLGPGGRITTGKICDTFR